MAEKNHDGPHVWRESDGRCAVAFCNEMRPEEDDDA